MKKSFGVGLLGLGVVGGGVVSVLRERGEPLAMQAGGSFVLKRVLVRDLTKARPATVAPELLTLDPQAVLEDPEIDIVIEAMGGLTPAAEYIERALRAGKPVVTANKEVMAKHGFELLSLAREMGVALRYEASVGGGIPLLAPLRESLAANRVSAILAIINGTTNYILTRMAQEEVDFGTALAEAQALGYAEPDPSYDVDGTDAASKLAILAMLAFRSRVAPEQVYREGIAALTPRDFRYARELGYAIKLLAIAKEREGRIEIRVHPAFLHQEHLLAKVGGVFNAIQIQGDLVGEVIFYGRGAGALPTSSAVVADLIDVARSLRSGNREHPWPVVEAPPKPCPMAKVTTRYYLRMSVADRPGVLAQIAQVLGDNQISIASVIQKEVDESAQTAEIVIMTHLALEAAMQTALKELATLSVVSEIGTMLRVED